MRVYCENHMGHINTLQGQSAEILMFEMASCIVDLTSKLFPKLLMLQTLVISGTFNILNGVQHSICEYGRWYH